MDTGGILTYVRIRPWSQHQDQDMEGFQPPTRLPTFPTNKYLHPGMTTELTSNPNRSVEKFWIWYKCDLTVVLWHIFFYFTSCLWYSSPVVVCNSILLLLIFHFMTRPQFVEFFYYCDVWCFYSLGLLRIKLLEALLHVPLGESKYSFLWSKLPGEKLLLMFNFHKHCQQAFQSVCMNLHSCLF